MAHLVSLPNKRGEAAAKFLHSDDPALIAHWVKAEDRPGFGVYDVLNPLRPGATRHGKDSISDITHIFVDIDAKDVVEDEAAIERKLLRELPLRPTRLSSSGHGWHVVWELKEPIPRDSEDFDLAVRLQEQLIEYLAGDWSVRPWSLLRRPGTLNSKETPFVPCQTIAEGVPVDLPEVAALCELVAGTPSLTRREQPVNGKDHGANADHGPVDVEAMFAAMRPGATHEAKLRCTSSMLSRGLSLVETVRTFLDEARRVITDDRDWDADQIELEGMCFDWIKKHPELASALPDELRGDFEAILAEGRDPRFWYQKATRTWNIKNYTRGKVDKGGPDPRDTHAPQSQVKGPLTLSPWVAVAEASLPPRAWLYGKHYQRGTVSLSAGPGGMGKSSLDLVEAVAMVAARNLLGEQPEAHLRLWYHNGEDPRDELDRKLVAICKHHEIDPHRDLNGGLFVTSGAEFPLRVAKGYNNFEPNETLVRRISDEIGKNQIDVAIFDPFVTLHSVSEVDVGKMDAVIRLFASISSENSACTELAHHMRKPAAGDKADYDVHDIRGVGAITDAVRAARVLNRMNEKDAIAAGCGEVERLARFRVDRAKGNYSPAQAAIWRQFINVELLNGDDVGVVAHWDFPGQGETTPERLAADHKAEEVFLQLLRKFTSRGVNVSANAGPTYAPSRFAEEREAKLAKVYKAHLVAAMSRLLDEGCIMSEPLRGGRSHRLVVA